MIGLDWYECMECMISCKLFPITSTLAFFFQHFFDCHTIVLTWTERFHFPSLRRERIISTCEKMKKFIPTEKLWETKTSTRKPKIQHLTPKLRHNQPKGKSKRARTEHQEIRDLRHPFDWPLTPPKSSPSRLAKQHRGAYVIGKQHEPTLHTIPMPSNHTKHHHHAHSHQCQHPSKCSQFEKSKKKIIKTNQK